MDDFQIDWAAQLAEINAAIAANEIAHQQHTRALLAALYLIDLQHQWIEARLAVYHRLN